MIRPVKLGIASLKALGMMLVMGAVGHASLPYLPLIGPPPLRLQAVKTPPANLLKFQVQPVPAAATSGTNSSLAAPVPALNVNAIVPGAPLVSAPAATASPEMLLGDSFTASILALPTPDLMTITPQMLATYFRPMGMGTNGALLNGPFRVSFMPPLPPDKSSHAEYIVK